jgi:hypothetical protein
MLADNKTTHGNLSQRIYSTPEKYRTRQIGHSKAALQIPMIEKKSDISPNVVSPITFLNKT